MGLDVFILPVAILFAIPPWRNAFEMNLATYASPIYEVYTSLNCPLKLLMFILLHYVGGFIFLVLSVVLFGTVASIYERWDDIYMYVEAVSNKVLEQINNIASSLNSRYQEEEPDLDKMGLLEQVNHNSLNIQWYLFLTLFISVAVCFLTFAFLIKRAYRQIEALSIQIEVVSSQVQLIYALQGLSDVINKTEQELKFYLRANHLSNNPDESLCVTCLDRKKNCVFFPCLHLCSCEECARVICSRPGDRNCPVCRCSITRRPLRVFP